MAFAPVKPGGWAFGELLSSAHMNALDADHANAIDGQGGGTYVLTDPLIIGGNYLGLEELRVPLIRGAVTIEDEVEFEDTPTFREGAVFYNGFTVQTGDALVGALYAGGLAQFFGNTQLFGNLTTVGNANTDVLRVYAQSDIRGPVVIGVTPDEETLTIRHSTIFEGAISLKEPITKQAGGYIRAALFVMTNADANRGPTTPCDEVFVPAGVLSSNRVFRIVDCENNGCMFFSSDEENYYVRVEDPAGNLLLFLWQGGGGSGRRAAMVRRISGTWQVTMDWQ